MQALDGDSYTNWKRWNGNRGAIKGCFTICVSATVFALLLLFLIKEACPWIYMYTHTHPSLELFCFPSQPAFSISEFR